MVYASTLTSKSGFVAFLSVIATIATDKLTLRAYATAKPQNTKMHCICRTPNRGPKAKRGTVAS